MRSALAITFLVLCLSEFVTAQLKFIVEDFEGVCNGTGDLHKNGIFDYGCLKANTINETGSDNKPFYVQNRCLHITRSGSQNFGGWGKGISLNVDLDPLKDHFNFYFLGAKPAHFKILLQEDDNHSGAFEKEADDIWIYEITISTEVPSWKLISVLLNKFSDANKSGDGIFNCNYEEGKLLTVTFSFENDIPAGFSGAFDFLCFSEEELITSPSLSSAQCGLGLWSAEGNQADFKGIAVTFEKVFGKKPLVVHLFQSLSDGGQMLNINSSVEAIENLLGEGYIPMITLEDHYVDPNGPKKNRIQPNLYSIIEGHYDFFFTQWAMKIKELNGTVLVRILHEFNGDWYPWCIVKNDKDPKLFIKAYRHIRDIFTKLNVTNAKFIWCPNSMSLPQASWNFIPEAYPGDEYVDIIGADIYNGSGENSGIWRSFRREAIEIYFLITKYFPDKPFIVCETASRERRTGECSGQDKAEWIAQMSDAVKHDLSGIKLLNWFNEKEPFIFNSSSSSQRSFMENIVNDPCFQTDQQSVLQNLK